MKKINLSYVKQGSSFIHPLYSEDGKKILDARVVLTAEMLNSFEALYGNIYFKSDTEKVKIPHYRVKMVYNNSREILDEIEKTNKLSKAGYRAAEKVVDEVLNDLSSVDIEAIDLLKTLSGFDEYLYNHSVNVGFLVSVFAMKCGWFSEDEIRSLSLGAYLHDIGHRQIDKQLLNKEGKFDISEYQKVKRHPQLGYEIIKNVNDTDPMIQQSILFHHEKYNGEGYYQLPYENLPVYPKIISICDIYDALTSQRPFRKTPFSPRQALLAIVNSVENIFDYPLVESFMKIMPQLLQDEGEIFTPGSICALNSDEFAVIRSNNSLEIMKPVVDIFCAFSKNAGKLNVQYFQEAIRIDLSKEKRYITKILTNQAQIESIKKALAEKKLIENI